MPAYLSQIAAGASAAAGSRRALSPTIRSRSPIAERDQRLTLTDMDWNFEEPLATGTAAFETTVPMEPATHIEPVIRIEPATPTQTPAKPLPRPSSPIPAIDELPPDRPDSQHQAQEGSASDPLRSQQAPIKPSTAASNIPWPDQKPLAEDSLPSREQVSEPAKPASVQPSHPEHGTTEHSPRAERRSPQMAVPATAKADPGTPMIVVNTVPQASEPKASVRDFPEASRSEQSQLPELPPLIERQTGRHREAVGPELSPEPGRPSVIINHIQVEVVPPAAERSTPKPASPATARSTPVSQIGPLRGVAKHLAFSIRHR